MLCELTVFSAHKTVGEMTLIDKCHTEFSLIGANIIKTAAGIAVKM